MMTGHVVLCHYSSGMPVIYVAKRFNYIKREYKWIHIKFNNKISFIEISKYI